MKHLDIYLAILLTSLGMLGWVFFVVAINEKIEKDELRRVTKPQTLSCDTIMTEPLEIRQSLQDSILTGKIKIKYVFVSFSTGDSIK